MLSGPAAWPSSDTAAGCYSFPQLPEIDQTLTTHSWEIPNVLGIQLNTASSGSGYHNTHHPEGLMIL